MLNMNGKNSEPPYDILKEYHCLYVSIDILLSQ
jgi:hypothetical protein